MSAEDNKEDKDEVKAETASQTLDSIYCTVLQGIPKVKQAP